MQVRLIYLLLNLIMLIQVTAIVLPSNVVEIIEPVVHRRVRTNWHVLRLHRQDILLVLDAFQFAGNASFAATYC